MRFVIDAMLPPSICELLAQHGHDAVTPTDLGAHNLSDEEIIAAASEEHRVIVTENAQDFARVTACPVLLVRKAWWPAEVLPARLAAALERWAAAMPEPGQWAHWLTDSYR